jgi:putative tricarboxylic transport membrane protein
MISPTTSESAVSGSPGNRWIGVVLVLAGLAVGAEASTFDVAFLTDPVGPKALPFVVALIFMATGTFLAIRPGQTTRWPSRSTVIRMTGAIATFVGYALLLAPLGFVPATTLCVTSLSRLFGGPWRRSLGAALLLSVTLWYLFVWVLGLPLPLGSSWTR